MQRSANTTTTVFDGRTTTKEPLISVVVALYNAEETLDATLKSFDSQRVHSQDIEYVIVDDGSTDSSLSRALAWAKRQSNAVVLTKPNAGIASTRNVGLRAARGKWLTSVDPDDLIEPRYLSEVVSLLEEDSDEELALIATRVMVTRAETGLYGVGHPLDEKFRQGNRVIDLTIEPNAFAFGAATFVRRVVLLEHDLDYDVRVSPTFEDGHLILRYLSLFETPLVGLASSAHYFYRKSAAGASAVQSGWSKPEKYTDQVQYGYLGLLGFVFEQRGEIPDWLALAVLYDLVYYFKEFIAFRSLSRWATTDLGPQFIGLCRQVFGFLESRQLEKLRVNRPDWGLRQALIIGLFPDSPVGVFKALNTNSDGSANYVLIQRAGTAPVQLFVESVPVEARPRGIKNHSFYGELLAVETHLTLPQGRVTIGVGGSWLQELAEVSPDTTVETTPLLSGIRLKSDRIQEVAFQWTRRARVQERTWVRSLILGKARSSVYVQKAIGRVVGERSQRLRTDARLRRGVRRLLPKTNGDSSHWILLDHPERADDNAEHLYRYLRLHRPDGLTPFSRSIRYVSPAPRFCGENGSHDEQSKKASHP